MTAVVSRFQVVELYGSKTLDIELTDNTLIIVGENGSGKTTLLRILFYFLSGRWQSLIQFQFKSVSVHINKHEFKVSRDQLVNAFRKRDLRFLVRYPTPIRIRLRDLIVRGQIDRIQDEVSRLAPRYGIPAHTLEREVRNYLLNEEPTLFEGSTGSSSLKEIQATVSKVQSAMGAQILYLPTYRRIERELSSIFEGADSDDLSRYRQRQRETDPSYIELVEFGMKDVQQAVNSSIEAIRDFARENLNRLTLQYLSDVVNQTYLDVDVHEIASVPENTVRLVINRIDESILSQESKEHLFDVISSLVSKSDPTEHDRLIYHYFSNILRFQESLQEREKPISEFCDLCSQYISDKQFVYNNSTFSFDITAPNRIKGPETIEFADLSSGEKQIISLFSHLYLSGATRFFVLIDEPELSLSVPWQKRFLPDIRRGEFCSGVVAVTHSPFIYANKLKPYARSLGEFGKP
jgi:ABC-type transport system involved in cytochrome c biogenesis ATPase subunit